jgi:hypothetical protein
MSWNGFFIQSIKTASPIYAKKLWIDFDRENKITYKKIRNYGENH